VTALYAATALMGAFLLFWLEPLFARMVLPLLGGTPAVWNTCLMYFQAMLLVGYLYAHTTTRLLSIRRQVMLHVALLVISLVVLPVAIPGGWSPPSSGSVIPWLLAMLTVSLGPPFLVLAATAPLIQHWFASLDGPRARNPYPLYAASNAGSFIGLLAFPILFEPNLRLGKQADWWTIGYLAAVVLVAASGIVAWKRGVSRTAALDIVKEARPTRRDRLTWIALAFVPSSLLLGVTTYLTTDVAAAPLLWVVPLAIYLLTFVIVFARPGTGPKMPITLLHAVLTTSLVIGVYWRIGMDLRWAYALHLGLFAVTALVLHGRLAALRPSPSHLTEYYLWMALGGALGGVFNAIVAPVLFDSVLEYQLMVALACFLRPSKPLQSRKAVEGLRDAALAALPVVLIAGVAAFELQSRRILGVSVLWIVSVPAAAIAIALQSNAIRFGVSISAIVVAGIVVQRARDTIHRDRSFFGAYRVERFAPTGHVLYHGTTIHGAQFLDEKRRVQPVTYYHPSGPVGKTFRALDERLTGKRIGAVGLGAGSLLCYSKPGQSWTFFEIDPHVETIARNPRLFTYLRDCKVKPRIVLGDARLTLAREPHGSFSLILLDAFSSDAIPAHLLTREAFRLYERLLDDEGVLLVHISNRNLDLEPVVTAVAGEAGLVAFIDEYEVRSATRDRQLEYSSDWVAVARSVDHLKPIVSDRSWRWLEPKAGLKLWTDDYSDLFSVIRWKSE